MTELYRIRIPADAAPTTVERFLRRELGCSTHLIRRLKVANGMVVDGVSRRTIDPLLPGQELVLSLPPLPAVNVAPEPVPLAIVYEDADLIVLDKPAGVVVHPTHGVYAGTLANGLAYLWQQRGEPTGIHPIHRLDRLTTGLLVFAKHSWAHHRLDEQLLAHKLDRAYLALVWGHPATDAGTVDLPIGMAGTHPVERAIVEGGQAARTSWEVAERYADAAQLRLVLATGRTHQIRVHMAAIGHPLLGDTLYAADRPLAAPRQALHAAVLAFKHPRTGEPMRFESSLPPDLQAVRDRLATGSWARPASPT